MCTYAGVNYKPKSLPTIRLQQPTFNMYNVTRLDKRSPGKAIPQKLRPTKSTKIKIKKIRKTKFNCKAATYKLTSLFDFVYTHKCFPAGWTEFFASTAVKEIIKKISRLLKHEAKNNYIEPPMPKVFRAFEVALDDVKVVIIGQDPVPEAGEATGLAFSLQPGANPRDGVPTVFNMLVELKLEGMNVDLSNGNLSPWVKRGVLLLNAALTVRQGSSRLNAGSHQVYWKEFTRLLVEHISTEGNPIAWILWGDKAKGFAQEQKLIDTSRHFIKAGGHPSPQGPNAGVRFFGRNYFSCANDFLVLKGRGGVDWSLGSRVLFAKQPGACDEDGLSS